MFHVLHVIACGGASSNNTFCVDGPRTKAFDRSRSQAQFRLQHRRGVDEDFDGSADPLNSQNVLWRKMKEDVLAELRGVNDVFDGSSIWVSALAACGDV